MLKNKPRRNFIKRTTLAGIGVGFGINGYSVNTAQSLTMKQDQRVGIIGLDTSHSIEFTKLLNTPDPIPELAGYRVVAAYPWGSRDIESGSSRIPKYIKEIKSLGVRVVGSLTDLLSEVDVVLLETNDGRLHLEQALQVFKAGKPVFIDKPVAASLSDAIAIYNAADQYKVPLFSSSSVRYIQNVQDIREGKSIGKVIGANTFSPAHIEPSHPDLYWYGIHGVELLFSVMGKGCISVVRTCTDETDMVVGVWEDGRIGSFRGGRSGKIGFGGTAFGDLGNANMGPFESYSALMVKIIEFFRSGKAPVKSEETLEIYAFMQAAEESKKRGGTKVLLESVF
ncbi:Gfo/Idh/MocA family oxidoreductase [Arenibacter sp. S6351L]|uniref:Gfo/Idh/MocA family protein n=1 Tax=Arenibacter sp. S6351L TaxID=2926407 RepID=UPI001FF2B511|nr:Gfo/Idh/MocA family oxidoreductase [Arenibacter sp. S6351L]MCK0135324.1 Gfo/Idh/MocA family oxidoreductase [Arenibacter sp. S6351L]